MSSLVIALAVVLVLYATAGALRIMRWAKSTHFSVRGDGPEALVVLLLLWIVWPALRNAEGERP